MPDNQKTPYWEGAIDVLKYAKSPLTPTDKETAIIFVILNQHFSDAPKSLKPSILILGVTPKYVEASIRAGARVYAVDKSEMVIDLLWTGDIPGKSEAIMADWRDLPFSENSIDVIIGDGSLNTLGYPAEFRKTLKDFKTVLKPEGLLIFRHFTQYPGLLKTEHFAGFVRSGVKRSYYEWRLLALQSFQKNLNEGALVSQSKIYRILDENGIKSPPELRAPLRSINNNSRTDPEYNEPHLKLFFPTTGEMKKMLEKFFPLVEIFRDNHAMANECPIFCCNIL